MSRIGNTPIQLPDSVTVSLEADQIRVKGPKGELVGPVFDGLEVKQEDKVLRVINNKPESRQHRAWHGLLRALINNMVVGVSQGWSKELKLVGTGYRAKLQGKQLVLNVGFSHPVTIDVPEGLEVKVEGNTNIIVSGIDKARVGQLAAQIRAVKKPEPYKGKGIRYKDEVVRRKAGKAGKAA